MATKPKGTEKETSPNIYQRLAAVSKECTYVKKGSNTGQYWVTSHDDVTAKVQPYLLKHGVVYISTVSKCEQEGNRTKMEVETVFVNIDNPDDAVLVTTIGYGIDSQDKGPGKAMSYAVKFALLKTLGLATGTDADLEHIEYAKPAPKIVVDTKKPAPKIVIDTKTPADRSQAGRKTGLMKDLVPEAEIEIDPNIDPATGEPFDDGKYTPGAVYDMVKKSLAEFCEGGGYKKSDVNNWIRGQYGGRTIAKMQNDDGLLIDVLQRVTAEYTPMVGDNVTVGVIPGKVVEF